MQMPFKLQMTWIARRRGWYKKYRGKLYVVSARQLGAEASKNGSWRAANAWWEAKKTDIDSQPPEDAPTDPRASWGAEVAKMAAMQEYDRTGRLPSAVGVDFGNGQTIYSFAGIQKKADAIVNRATAAVDAAFEKPDPDRSVGGRAEAWYRSLRASVDAGRIGIPRWGAYQRNLEVFTRWVGRESPIEALTAAKLEEFYQFLSGLVGSSDYSPDYARSIFTATKQFISWQCELGLIPLPGNIGSRKFRFGKKRPRGLTKGDLFTPAEIRALLDRAIERLRLFLLLMLNTGMYQSGVSDLGENEVDWNARTITRSRSKTGAQVVTYKLWPETFELLVKYRHQGVPVLNARGSQRVLLTGEGKPLTAYWFDDGKERRYDTVQGLYSRLKSETGIRKPLKNLRKTAASELVKHTKYKFYAQYFLAHAPDNVADAKYIIPSDDEFFEALEWLRGRLIRVT